MIDLSFSDEFGYMTAPTSVASSCNNEKFFYSAPTSPSRRIIKLGANSCCQTSHTSPRTIQDEDDGRYSNLDEFEFETSRRFTGYLDTKKSQKDDDFDGDSLQTMAFADELFNDGKVLPLEPPPPLKLPPRLIQNNGDCGSVVMSAQSSTLTSPKSPALVLRLLPFSRHSLWNDEFDPFVAALEKVKDDKRGNSNSKAKNGLRRTRSLSPFRGFNHRSEKHVGISKTKIQVSESHCCELQKEPLLLMKQESRRVDMISVEESNDAAFETKEDERKRSGFWRRKKKNKKENSIVKLLFGNGYMRKSSDKHKLEGQKESLEKPEFMMRKLDADSVSSSQSTERDKDETRSDMSKMSLVCHKPRGSKLFLCLGHGGYVK
ncbi:hypothetical protein HN51_023957 [Arachis hypogaea]|uniref:Uncharacterized protein n=2 Tax=Arachis TaxID=3817 RepID=A0A445C434_ARAHY|nr:uncharacterized protein LOC110273882 [Arachis duranensis]XP_025608827.1 uncharacterized protein LOC112702124 [Arachis hypogaea]QHO26939.1 uncharacterized protein DS421_7g203750 [Arachis hypogaea]RYR45696.1 hypothetical protein Ahy_A07g031500 [Arachis hypogaea]